MSSIESIKSLYIFTTIINGKEQIVIGPDHVPFIYLSMELIEESKIIEQMQEWSNRVGACFKLQLFTQLTIVDVVEPIKSELTM